MQRRRKWAVRVITFLVFMAIFFFGFCAGMAVGSAAEQPKEEPVAKVIRALVEAGAACDSPTDQKYIPVEGIKYLAGIDTEAVLALPDQPEMPQARWTEDEALMLVTLAMAEAEGEDTEGKALVILTVLNRVGSDSFPDTIEGVIFDPGQFSPVKPGHRYYTVEPNADCWEALRMVENGWDESQGALYFRTVTNKSTWHSRNLEELFTHGNHIFYTEE